MTVPGSELPRVSKRVGALTDRYGLPQAAASRLQTLFEFVVGDPHSPTTVRDPQAVLDDHLADSLVALELAVVRTANVIADLGAGAGFPGLALAIALPATSVTLVESAGRKCQFMRRAISRCGIVNASVVHGRAEDWPAGLARHDLITARALASLSVVAEYAAPLLGVGGTLVAWRGRRDPEGEAAAARAAQELGLEVDEVIAVRPYPAAENRHLHLLSKVTETPASFPRRPGIARKRPLGRE